MCRARPRHFAVLLPRRPRSALARHRIARAIPEGPRSARRRLVDPRSREGKGRELAKGVADIDAGVGPDRAFHRPLVVVNEQARRGKVSQPLLHHIELDRCRDAVCRATADPSLVIDRRALTAKSAL